MAREFLRISEGPSIIRTTPTQSPALVRSGPSVRSVSFVGASQDRKLCLTVQKISPSDEPLHAVPPPDSRPARGDVLDVDAKPLPEANPPNPRETGAVESRQQPNDAPEGVATAASTRQDQRSVTFLPPILKKPRAGSQNQLPKTARVISPAFDDSTGEQSVSVGSPATSKLAVEPPSAASEASAGLSPTAGSAVGVTRATRSPNSPSSRAEKEPLQRPPKKRSGFVANSASNRRRPSAVRRKSSQSSSGSASKVTSPRLAAQATERTIPESSVLELPRNSLPGKDDRRWTCRCDGAKPFVQNLPEQPSPLCHAP